MSNLLKFTTVDPMSGMNSKNPGKAQNLLSGEWLDTSKYFDNIPDPVSGEYFIAIPDTDDLSGFIQNLDICPKSGLHNPIKNVERYVMLGNVCAKAAALLSNKEVEDFFVHLIQRVMPKSSNQCLGEVTVTRKFLENFSGDGVRFLARSFSNPGDHLGQESSGYRWPFGSVVIVAPFNFPLEIPALQFLGALFMGNRPLIKSATTVGIVFEQFLRLLIHCGLPATDADMVHCRGSKMGKLISDASDKIRMVQFTGSCEVAERIAADTNGKVRVEDAGFDWKLIGPDYDPLWSDYVAWQCDEDAYNASGQKCSAQSILFVHKNWEQDLLPKLKQLAERRKLANLSIGPVLTWNNDQLFNHINSLLEVPGATCLFGGTELESHNIPKIYGSIKPTAVNIPVNQLLGKDFELITSEVFGPVQVIVVYEDQDLPTIMKALEKIPQNLTAAVVSNDVHFQQKVLGDTVNGTTYAGMRARTTGAPQNHWFGPSGDPRSAGIGTPEAITVTWSGHREIIKDIGPLDPNWEIPDSF